MAGTPTDEIVSIVDGRVELPADPRLLTARFVRDGDALRLEDADGAPLARVDDYFVGDARADLSIGGAAIPGRSVDRLARPADLPTDAGLDGLATALEPEMATPPPQLGDGALGALGDAGQAAASIPDLGPAAYGEPVGQVSEIVGAVIAVRPNGARVALEPGAPIYQDDVLETADDAAVGVTMIDGMTFSLGDGGRMTIDEFHHAPEINEGGGLFTVLQGAFSFVSGDAAHTGPDALMIETPTMTIGVRGTKVGFDLAAEGEASRVVLLAEEDGTVGEIIVQTDAGEEIISDANRMVEVVSRSAPPSEPLEVSNSDIARHFGEALEVLPAPAAFFDPQPVEAVAPVGGFGAGETDAAAEGGDGAAAAASDGGAGGGADGEAVADGETGEEGEEGDGEGDEEASEGEGEGEEDGDEDGEEEDEEDSEDEEETSEEETSEEETSEEETSEEDEEASEDEVADADQDGDQDVDEEADEEAVEEVDASADGSAIVEDAAADGVDEDAPVDDAPVEAAGDGAGDQAADGAADEFGGIETADVDASAPVADSRDDDKPDDAVRPSDAAQRDVPSAAFDAEEALDVDRAPEPATAIVQPIVVERPIETVAEVVAAPEPNQSPVLTADTALSLAAGDEDAGPIDARIADLVSTAGFDPDGDPLGVALTSLDMSAGLWSYALGVGEAFEPIEEVAEDAALLLGPDALLRLDPGADYNGGASASFRLWDGERGASGAAGVDATSGGGASSFSADTTAAFIEVAAVNDAPTYSGPSSMASTPVLEDSGPLTFSVSDLLPHASTADVDGDAVGVALTDVSGIDAEVWSRDAGGEWTLVDDLSPENALLLGAETEIQIRPAEHAFGDATLAFRVWDGSAGAAGDRADASAGGGETAFSAATVFFAAPVVDVNDAPTLSAPTYVDFSIGDHAVEMTKNADTLNPGADSFTVEAWIYWDGVSRGGGGQTDQAIVSKGGEPWNETGYSIFIFEDEVRFRITTEEGERAGGRIELGSEPGWRHVAMTVDQETGEVLGYVDGKTDGWTPALNGPDSAFTAGSTIATTSPFMVGKAQSEDGTKVEYNSLPVADVRVWEGARSPAEIQADMGRTLSGDEPGLIAHFPLDEGSGDVATDTVSGLQAYVVDPALWTPATNEFALDEGATVAGRLTGSDPDGDTPTYSIAENGSKGEATIDAQTGAWTYTAGEIGGSDTVTFQVDDGRGGVATLTKTFDIADENDAPVFGHGGAIGVGIGPVDEGSASAKAFLFSVNSLISSGKISDPDGGAVAGIVVTKVPEPELWSFSLDGGATFQSFAGVSPSNGITLSTDTLLKFAAVGDYVGDPQLSYRAWDGSDGGVSGQAGADTTVAGGSAPYSAQEAFVQFSVANVNDAPVLTASGIQPLAAGLEDAGPVEFAVQDLFAAATVSDVDGSIEKAVALTDLDLGSGAWSVSIGGGEFSSVSGVSEESALLLGANDRIRFEPSENFSGAIELSYVAWDGSTGAAGERADVSSRGGETAFSTTEATARFEVAAVNDAPVWTNGESAPALPAVTTDGGKSFSTVDELLAQGAATDVDGAVPTSIAVTNASAPNGSWWFRPSGEDWQAMSSVSESNALILDAGTQIKFDADPGATGSASLGFHVHDGSSGLSTGDRIDASSTGGSSALSATGAVATVALPSTPPNSAPELSRPGYLDFDDYSGRVAVEDDVDASEPLDPHGGAMTVEAWFYYDGVDDETHTLVSKGNRNTTEDGYSIFIKDGELVVRADGEPGARGASYIDIDDQEGWHHVAMVLDPVNGTITGYLNGSSDGWSSGFESVKDDLIAYSDIDSSKDFTIGAAHTGANSSELPIADVRVWSTARSAEEIQSDMGRTLSGTESDLVAYYPLASGSSGTTEDKANGYDGALTSSPAFESQPSIYVIDTDKVDAEDRTVFGRWSAEDPDGDELVFSVVGSVSKGEVTIDEKSGAWSFEAHEDATGSQSVSFQVTDSSGATDTATINFTLHTD